MRMDSLQKLIHFTGLWILIEMSNFALYLNKPVIYIKALA